jgi:hypothetical protein
MVRLLHLACRVWWLSSSAARLNFIPCVRASTCVPAPVSRPPLAHGYLLSYSDARWVTILLATAKAVFFLSLTVKMHRQFRRARTPRRHSSTPPNRSWILWADSCQPANCAPRCPPIRRSGDGAYSVETAPQVTGRHRHRRGVVIKSDVLLIEVIRELSD